MRNAIGHNVRYQTHDINPKKGDSTANELDEGACGCPHLLPTSKTTLNALLGESMDSMLYNNHGRGLKLRPAAAGSRYATNYPYLVVTTDAEVIADHNAIYSEKFTTFTQQFLLKHIVLKQPLPARPDSVACWPDAGALNSPIPYERSCQQDDGSVCTRQTLGQ
jgi:hypothetical protein